MFIQRHDQKTNFLLGLRLNGHVASDFISNGDRDSYFQSLNFSSTLMISKYTFLFVVNVTVKLKFGDARNSTLYDK
jgi:hypothetical protein